MKKISKANARQKAVSNVVATLRIEQLTPSPEVVQGLEQCQAGKATPEQLRADILNRHVPLRRI